MINVKNIAAQGDVLFRRVGGIPANARESAQTGKGPIVVAHSETGHHHVIESSGVTLFDLLAPSFSGVSPPTVNPLISYLKLDGAFADVVHRRSHDTHETLRLLGAENGPAYYEVRRQREHTPLGWRRALD